MGCSASRPNTLLTKSHHQYNQEEEPSSSSSSLESTTFPSANCHSSSPKPVPPRALSLLTPLVHHPPSRKGDSHHLVSLTSTTYGSLLLIDTQVSSLNPPSPQKSTVESSLSPDSVINTWELMHGLDDEFDCDLNLGKPISSSKPLWKHLSEESLLSKMDPNVASSYRKALSSRQLGYSHHQVISSPLKTKNQVLIYFTSLRGIRKTYEDCCSVRMIFKAFRVPVDERDISMDSMFRKELQDLVGGKAVSLPQVFIKGKHIGGGEEIKHMNEAGELVKLLDGLPVGDPLSVCQTCGDARFLPCPHCSGSRKVFHQIEQQLRRCSHCNENGLIRCPACSS